MRLLLILLAFPSILCAQMSDSGAFVKASQSWGPVSALGRERGPSQTNWTHWVGIQSVGCRQDFTHFGSGLGSWNPAFADSDAHPPNVVGLYKGPAMSINVTGYRAGVQSIKYTLDSLSPIQTGIMLAPLPAVLNVGGMLTLSVAASDNVGVVGVQVKLDGANLGPELAVPPYLVRWNSASVPDGPHNFTATARDAAGNSTTTPPLNTTVGNADPIALIPVDISKLADGLHVACVSWINREGRLDWADPILFRVNQTTGFSNGVRQLVITP